MKNRDSKKVYIVEDEENIRIISKETMNDTDLLVNIHNSLVLIPLTLVSIQQDNKRCKRG